MDGVWSNRVRGVRPIPHRFAMRRMAACAGRDPNTRLLDRFHLSKGHPSWFTPDGYHLSSTGRTRYASFLDAGTS